MRYYTLPQLARRWDVTRQLVHRWVQDGRIKAIKPGSEYLVSEHNARRPVKKKGGFPPKSRS